MVMLMLHSHQSLRSAFPMKILPNIRSTGLVNLRPPSDITNNVLTRARLCWNNIGEAALNIFSLRWDKITSTLTPIRADNSVTTPVTIMLCTTKIID